MNGCSGVQQFMPDTALNDAGPLICEVRGQTCGIWLRHNEKPWAVGAFVGPWRSPQARNVCLGARDGSQVGQLGTVLIFCLYPESERDGVIVSFDTSNLPRWEHLI